MEFIGFTGFILAASAYLIFALLIFAAKNKTLFARWMLVSVLVTFASYAVAFVQIKLSFNLQWVMLADGVKIASWSILVLLCNTQSNAIGQLWSSRQIRQYLLVWSLLMVGFYAVIHLLDYSLAYLFYLFLILNLWSLVLLEQLYRSADDAIRWAILPLVIALASMAIFDFVLYAQASMINGLNFDFWFSRGYLATLVMPLLLISTRRIKDGAVRIFVSRHVVFYSSMLMIAGLYLLAMASAGYLINYFGGEWGASVSIGFLVLSSIVLLALFMTDALRRQVKVFIAKNFFANRYEYRDEWLDLIDKIESTTTNNHYQMATHIMMSKLDAASGAVVKRTSATQFEVKYSQGVKINDEFTPQLLHLSDFCNSKGWIIDIDEYRHSPQLYPQLLLDITLYQQQNVRILVPLFIGKVFYGFFVLSDLTSVNKLNWEDRDLIFAVSKQLGNYISLHEANEQLAQAKQFDAFHRMSAFLVHDLKNVQAQLSLVSSNAAKHRNNPDFIDDVFETVDSATSRLGHVLSQLRNKQIVQSSTSVTNINQLIEQVVAQRNLNSPQVSFEAASDCHMAIDYDTFYAVINHLLQNAQEATSVNGSVKISLYQQDQLICLKIADNGSGMSADFIAKRLYKPFDTTKGNAGMGIGVFEAKQFVEGIAGTIKVESIEGKGTTFTLSLPI
jgi:putative PEP-CTERM system histidine kinase